MKHSYNYHADPGHGWLAVPVRDAFDLGLTINHFSAYSAQSRSGSTLYLEEDSDAPIFVNQYKKIFGKPPVFVEKHIDQRHWIRSMPRIKDED